MKIIATLVSTSSQSMKVHKSQMKTLREEEEKQVEKKEGKEEKKEEGEKTAAQWWILHTYPCLKSIQLYPMGPQELEIIH